MLTTFHLHTKELNDDFLKTLKKMFKNKRISISVEEELDETEYLLSTEVNQKHLASSIASEKIVKYSISELKAHSTKLKSVKKLKRELLFSKKLPLNNLKIGQVLILKYTIKF